ncbi:triosephosphate isomerase, putative [Eimeria acervulina]|uniref:Triosephosphate isomerase n=1 Tax=Eimeria acervulina TaxID=5801 RepID=U6GTY4_EIMAC|nr:triosephosphate isomerase, putative [Eimeria acervulina]CDI83726.1 triosephosphate isomerase, putative [Eimeria acervulina]
MLNNAPPEVVVAPPSLHAGFVLRGLQRRFNVGLQDGCLVNTFGAFTGEINPQMMKDFGIKAVIVGHSERRAGFGKQPGESNEVVAAKAKNAVNHGLQVIACIGESLETRQSGKTMEFLGKQLEAYASALSASDWQSVVIAYEPIWAIGTGKTATPQMAQQTHKEIREWLRQHVGEQQAKDDLFGGEDIDGFLVGGASLTEDFHAILKAAKAPKP